MKVFLTLAVVMVLSVSTSFGAFLSDDFDDDAVGSAPEDAQWSAVNVIVTNNQTYNSSAAAAALAASAALTNTISETGVTKAWTDFQIRPALGAEPNSPATATASALFYFNADGYVTIYTNGAWAVCSNDIWNATVTPVTSNAYSRVSVYQNYSVDKYAVFLEGQCLLQDIPFPNGGTNNYTSFIVESGDGNAYLDDVNIQVAAPTGTGTTASGNDVVDATEDIPEIDTNGYLARRLYVGGNGSSTEYPSFDSITGAVAVARNGDDIRIMDAYAGIAEDVDISASGSLTNLAFSGNDFTTGTFTVNSGITVTLAQSVNVTGTFTAYDEVTFTAGTSLEAGTIVLDDNVTLTTVANMTVDVAGTLTLGAGATLDAASGTALTVNNLTLGDGATLVAMSGSTDLTIGDLNAGANSSIQVTSGTLTEDTAGIDLTGTFTIDGGEWGTVVAQWPMTETFESYGANSSIGSYGIYGWTASGSDVQVKASEGFGGSKALLLPDGSAATNLIAATVEQVWTTYRLRPALGVAPSDPSTSQASFMSYVSSNGTLNVHNGIEWIACDEKLGGGAAGQFATNTWRRVALHQDFGTKRFAVFVGNGSDDLELVQQLIPFPGGSVGDYTHFIIDNQDGNAYIDDITVSSSAPTEGATLDLDDGGSGTPDVEEVGTKGYTFDSFGGALFRFS